ncbi:MAG: hypothetical protein ACOX7D_00985 [Alphaproteobacteria bacterium]
MKNKNRDFYKEQKGAGLIETLLAIAIVGAIIPFAYNGAINMSNQIADISESKHIIAWGDPIMAYVRKNQSDWPSNAQVEFNQNQLKILNKGDNRLLDPYAGFIEKREDSSGTSINAYIAFRPIKIKKIRVANIVRNLGTDAAIVESGGEAISSAGWGISSELFSEGDLIFRISDILGKDDSYKYLHRIYLDNIELNTMYRDIDMVKNNIFDIGKINAKTLNSTNVKTWFVESGIIKTKEIFFPEGMSIDASNAEFESINVSDDISGFRNITADKLKGIGTSSGSSWSSRGDIIVDMVNINGPIHVQNDMIVRSESSRIITSFAGIRAQSIATPFLSTDNLIFQKDFGITISGELLYSSTGGAPIRLGRWYFPSINGPRFSNLFLKKVNNNEIGETLIVPNNNDFLPIITSGWQDM